MISRDSKSYPYLAIAQHYDIPYWAVLRYSETVDIKATPPYNDWKFAVWCLEKDKKYAKQN